MSAAGVALVVRCQALAGRGDEVAALLARHTAASRMPPRDHVYLDVTSGAQLHTTMKRISPPGMMGVVTASSSSPQGAPAPGRKVSFAAAARILAERDPVIARLVAEAGPPRLSRPAETHLGTLVRAIVYQQLAGRAAAAIHGRLIAALGGDVSAESLIALTDEQMRAAGLSRAKVASLRDLAAKVTAPTARELRPLGDPFRPYRSVTAWHCWRAVELYAGAAESALTR